jgi:serine/threonine-protein kinase
MSDATSPPLGGRYELRRRLGASRAAEVVLAHDRQLDRPVAVKLLSSELSRDPAIVERFRRAASAAATLTGPNVVTVYDWGEDAGRAYVAMELVDGESLADRLAATPRLGVEQAAATGIGVADALEVAHRAGQVHGSLTPRDVLLTRAGTVKVTDFGTAAAGLASAGGDAGEAAVYAAPEQLQGGAATPASDLYALGVILSEAVAGAPPFAGDPVTVTRRKLEEPPRPPSVSAPGVPPGFDAIVARLLERDPARRYGTAAEAARDLERLRETVLVPAAAPTQPMAAPATALPAAVPRRDDDRSATPWIVAAVVLVLLIAGAVVLWALTRDDGDTAKQVAVPAVVGQRAAEASAAITDAGLSPSTVSEPSDDFAAGIVFSQAPKADAKAREGSVVVLKVSAGPTTTTTSSTSTTSTSTTSTSTTSTSTTSTSTTTTTTPP